jgi:hypothetical protein
VSPWPWFVNAFGLLVVAGVVYQLARGLPPPGYDRWAYSASGVVAIYGWFAFFVQAAAASGGLSFLPSSLEFPVWRPDRVVRDGAGRTIVGLVPSGRVQVYDTSGRFERGWFVPASGGDFVLAPPLDGRITVLTQRNVLRLVYDERGTLLSREARERGAMVRGPSAEMPSGIAAPILAWPLASPLLAWGIGVAGMFGVWRWRVKPAPRVTAGRAAGRPWDWRR